LNVKGLRKGRGEPVPERLQVRIELKEFEFERAVAQTFHRVEKACCDWGGVDPKHGVRFLLYLRATKLKKRKKGSRILRKSP